MDFSDNVSLQKGEGVCMYVCVAAADPVSCLHDVAVCCDSKNGRSSDCRRSLSLFPVSPNSYSFVVVSSIITISLNVLLMSLHCVRKWGARDEGEQEPQSSR